MKFIKYNDTIYNLTELKRVYFSKYGLIFEFKQFFEGHEQSFSLSFQHLTQEVNLKICNIVFDSFCEFLDDENIVFDVNFKKDTAECFVAY